MSGSRRRDNWQRAVRRDSVCLGSRLWCHEQELAPSISCDPRLRSHTFISELQLPLSITACRGEKVPVLERVEVSVVVVAKKISKQRSKEVFPEQSASNFLKMMFRFHERTSSSNPQSDLSWASTGGSLIFRHA